MSNVTLPPQPSAESKDIVDLIQYDHLIIESHFRAMRDRTSNRPQLLHSFANLLLAHSDAEEEHVYPRIREAAKAADEHKSDRKENAETQHTAALMALLALMEQDVSDHTAWETKLEALILGVCTHAAEEEMTLLNAARTDMSPQQRADLGAAFSAMRASKLAQNLGTVDNVRQLVKDRATLMQQLKEKLMG
jgi:hypothetical protein